MEMKQQNKIIRFIVSRQLLLLISFIAIGFSCTKLDVKVYDQATNFWQTADQIAAGVAPAYSGLRNYPPAGPLYNINEVTTDEIIVPNRIINWADTDMWEELWKHTWGPNLPIFAETWQMIYGEIARINLIIQALNSINPKPGNIVNIEAELKTVRAFYYYQLIDLFGNVPILEIGSTDTSLGTKPRSEVFNYIELELKNSLPFLSADVNPKTYGRATKWFAYAILAKLYLNAEVFIGQPAWTQCIEACNAILSSGIYRLDPDFFANFRIQNQDSRENIFSIPFDIDAGLWGFGLQYVTLHYNSNLTFGLEGYFGLGGFNGHCSTAEYLNLFRPDDKRKQMFLVGQQYVDQIADAAHLQYDNLGNLLSFDPAITSFRVLPPKTEVAGARCAKWEFNVKGGVISMSNDLAVYRLADIILMKSEALFRLNDVSSALAAINEKINGVSIRARAGLPDFTAAEINADNLLTERARELSWEGFRRNDMIRLGHFTDSRIPEKNQSENFRKLFPIPAVELAKNPNLQQNPGY